MNVKRFTARTSRDALSLVRQALGDDAVVLSTKPSAGGVEVLAMAPEGMRQVERMSAEVPSAPQAEPAADAAPSGFLKRASADVRIEPQLEDTPVEADVERLAMSTLSFQDYVRDRMLKRRKAALQTEKAPEAAPEKRAEEIEPTAPAAAVSRPAPVEPIEMPSGPLAQRMAERGAVAATPRAPTVRRETPTLHDPMLRASDIHVYGVATPTPARADADDMMKELRSMKGLIEERFGALAFMDRMQRQPGQARLTQKLLDCGFSPALIRKLGDGLAADVADESLWAAGVLERNLMTAEDEAAIEDLGGVYALVGPTGVGKTTTHREDRGRLRDQVRCRQPRPRHPRCLPARRPRAAARLWPHPRRAGPHRARPRLARRPARPADREEDGPGRHRRHGAARQPDPRAARHAGAPLGAEAAGRQCGRAGRDDRGRDRGLPGRELRRCRAVEDGRGGQARPGARCADPASPQGDRRGQRPARPRGLAPAVGAMRWSSARCAAAAAVPTASTRATST